MVPRTALALAAVLFALAASPASAGRAVEVFEIHYSNAAELKGAVEAVLGETGKVTVSERANALVVVDDARVIEQVRAVLAALDRKPANIHIDVAFIEKSELERLGVDIAWRAGGAGWSIGAGNRKERGASANLWAAVSRAKRKTTQSLTLTEGRPGRIRVGEDTPFTDYFIEYGIHHGHISKNVSFRQSGTSFSVRVRTAGHGKLVVDLEPEVSYYDRKRETFKVKNASTSITMGDPGTVAIGGVDEGGSSFNANFLRGVGSREDSGSFVMILSARSGG